MLSKKRMVEVVLNDEANSYVYTYEEAKKLIQIEEEIITFRSLFGFTLNFLYNQLTELEDDEEKFSTCVRKEVHDDYQIFMFMLRDKKPIEKRIDQYILDNYKDILANKE